MRRRACKVDCPCEWTSDYSKVEGLLWEAQDACGLTLVDLFDREKWSQFEYKLKGLLRENGFAKEELAVTINLWICGEIVKRKAVRILVWEDSTPSPEPPHRKATLEARGNAETN